VFQPFFVAGVGFASNHMRNWTRVNIGRPDRTFEGAGSLSFAWSVGIGAWYQVTKAGD
jgi:opacity protein-like surface antigen